MRYKSLALAVVVVLSSLLVLNLPASFPQNYPLINLIPSTGSVYAEFARYKDKDRREVAEVAWQFLGSGWAYKNVGSNQSIWITNAHVVNGASNQPDSQGRWWFPTGRYGIRLQGDFIIPGRLIAKNEEYDLAAILVDSISQPVACIAEGAVPVGKEIVVIGHPLGIRFAVSYGRVLRENNEKFDTGIEGKLIDEGKYKGGHIFIDARITHGNSGSPVFLVETGCVVGVVRAYWVAGNAFFQMGEVIPYAIPNTTLLEFLKTLP